MKSIYRYKKVEMLLEKGHLYFHGNYFRLNFTYFKRWFYQNVDFEMPLLARFYVIDRKYILFDREHEFEQFDE